MEIEVEISELDGVVLDGHPVEEGAARPSSESSAETVGAGCIALQEGIGPCGVRPYGEVVVSLLAIAAVEEGLLPAGLEGNAPVSADFAHRFQAFAFLDGDTGCPWKQINR